MGLRVRIPLRVPKHAEVVELAYTRDLGSRARKGLRVRVPPSVPNILSNQKKTRRCSFPGCNKRHSAKGLCNSHWAQMNRHGRLSPIRTEESIEERFWRQVRKTNACWEWLGPGSGKAKKYGQLYYRGKRYMAHRLSFSLHGGQLEANMHLDHLCRNTRCVNPGHLELVTRNVNIKRMHAYHDLVTEIQRLRDLVKELGGKPGADILADR